MHNFLVALQSIDPVALRIGPLSVRWYGIAYATGFLCAFVLMRSFARRWKTGLSTDDLLTVLLYAIIGVVAGGRLGYCLFYGPGYYLSHPLEIPALWDGGMSFHGGFIGILLGGYIASRQLKVSFLTVADLGAIGAPIGFGLGRIANFINGELWGRVTTSSWGIVFAGAGSSPRIPSQLLEALLEGLVLFLIVLFLAYKKPPLPQGSIIGWLTIFYGCFRIFSEFFREPDVGIGFIAGNWLTMGIILSLPMVIGGIVVVAWSKKRGLLQENAFQKSKLN